MLLRVDRSAPAAPLQLRTADGEEHWAAIDAVGRMPARREVACAFCARRDWLKPTAYKTVELWNVRRQRGREPPDGKGAQWEKDASACAYDPGDTRAQAAIAGMLCPVRYHNRHPNIPLDELVRSCVRVPWGKEWGGWYEPPPELAPFADTLAGGAPLLIHRRRVPDESAPGANEKWVTWGPGDEPKVLGPRVWACVECSRGLRPGTNPDGVRPLPKITRHMLTNDCWGGMMDPRIAALTPLALLFLLVLRTVRRRWYSPGPKGTPGMPNVLGHSSVAPCVSGKGGALKWPVDDAGKVAVPGANAGSLQDCVEFVLPRPLRIPGPREDRTPEQLRAAFLEELEGHEWARVPRQLVRDGAECMRETAPGGFVRVNNDAIDALPENGVPQWMADLMTDPDAAADDIIAPAGQGPADATAWQAAPHAAAPLWLPTLGQAVIQSYR